MASEPFFDVTGKGRWRIKWWAGPERGWKTETLCGHPQPWTKDRKPKRPPPEVQLLAQKYRDLEVKARHGISVAPVRGHNLSEYLDTYRQRFARTKSPGSVPSLDRSIMRFKEHCQSAKVSTIEGVTIKTCRDFLHWRAETIGHATLKAEKGLLSRIWTEARMDGIIPANPWASAAVPGKPKTDTPPYWTQAELDRLIAGSKGWIRDMIIVGSKTGLRISALLGLEWRDVNFDLQIVSVRQALAKGGRAYHVPMGATANEVFARRWIARDPANPLVFPAVLSGKRMRSKVSFDKIQKLVHKLGLPDYGHYNHMLRHTFATLAVMSGVPLLTVSSWLGHSSIKMSERYAHVIPSESHRQMDRFDSASLDNPETPRREARGPSSGDSR